MPNPIRTRARILEEFIARVGQITRANGFITDAGEGPVYIGETPILGPDDPQFGIAIVPGDEEVRHNGANFYIELPISVQAVCRLSALQVTQEEFSMIEALLTDIKSAVETGDRAVSGTFGGLIPDGLDRQGIRTVPREPGALIIAVGVNYLAAWSEGWGDQ